MDELVEAGKSEDLNDVTELIDCREQTTVNSKALYLPPRTLNTVLVQGTARFKV